MVAPNIHVVAAGGLAAGETRHHNAPPSPLAVISANACTGSESAEAVWPQIIWKRAVAMADNELRSAPASSSPLSTMLGSGEDLLTFVYVRDRMARRASTVTLSHRLRIAAASRPNCGRVPRVAPGKYTVSPGNSSRRRCGGLCPG